MKLFIPLISLVSSTPFQILNVLQKLSNVTTTTRSMLPHSYFSDVYFKNYGCWCNFGENGVGLMKKRPFEGKGLPKDSWDEACRHLQWGYECAMIKSEERADPKICEPHLVEFKMPNQFNTLDEFFNGGGSMGFDGVFMCEWLNEGKSQCAIDACLVETSFVARAAELLAVKSVGLINPDPFDESLKHSEGFDMEGECVGQLGSPGTLRTCCGEIPSVRPYVSDSESDRECCYNEVKRDPVVFSSKIYQCCTDFSVKMVGTC